MAKGDILFFFTDGVSDAARGPDPDGDALGVDGLTRIFLKRAPPIARGSPSVCGPAWRPFALDGQPTMTPQRSS